MLDNLQPDRVPAIDTRTPEQQREMWIQSIEALEQQLELAPPNDTQRINEIKRSITGFIEKLEKNGVTYQRKNESPNLSENPNTKAVQQEIDDLHKKIKEYKGSKSMEQLVSKNGREGLQRLMDMLEVKQAELKKRIKN